MAHKLLEANAGVLLKAQGSRFGYGIHINGSQFWDGRHHAHAQYVQTDPDSLPLHDWGVAHDPGDFYRNKAHGELQMG